MTNTDAEHVETAGIRIDYDAIGEREGQCGWQYPGAAGRCPADSEYVTTIRWGDVPEPVPLCEKHAMEAQVDE